MLPSTQHRCSAAYQFQFLSFVPPLYGHRKQSDDEGCDDSVPAAQAFVPQTLCE